MDVGAESSQDGPEASLAERPLSSAAARALAEAAERHGTVSSLKTEAAIEIAGRPGPDPIRYGDWEVKGLATDF